MKVMRAVEILGALLLMANGAAAEAGRTVIIKGRQSVTVTAPTIRLGDIAEISSDRMKDDESIIGLQKINIEKSPLPGREITLSASTVLEHIKGEGVNLDQVGYTFPRVMVVHRAGRVISAAEVRTAIESYLAEQGRDVELRTLAYDQDQYVAPGNVKLDVSTYSTLRSNEIGFQITAADSTGEAVRFNATAQVEEWRQMPVANRTLGRGSIVGPEDVVMARLNVAGLPTDIARDTKQVIGFEASHDIGAGQVFRQANLAIPPVIDTGAKVVLRYKSSAFEATASGTALEAGIKGQQIRIKNDASSKILYGTVIEPGLAEVQ